MAAPRKCIYSQNSKKCNTPVINWNIMKEDDNNMKTVISYIDSIVTTELNATRPERHLCQKSSNEIDYEIQDYIELINKLQRHTRCNASYCLRKKKGQEICRFGYPKEYNNHTIIQEDTNGQAELITKRND